jgi:hypothetical protein
MLRGRTEKRCDDSPCTRFPSRRTAREAGRRKNAVVGLWRASLNSAAADSSPSAPTSRTDAACIYCTCHVPPLRHPKQRPNNSRRSSTVSDGLAVSNNCGNFSLLSFFVFFGVFVFFGTTSSAMEFQAIVLADHDDGSGTRLYPLLEKTPKSLLPIAGRPLIAYQLALLERSGFKEVGGARCAAPGMRSRSACPGL